MPQPTPTAHRRYLLPAGITVFAVVAGLAVWKWKPSPAPTPTSTPTAEAITFPGLDLEDPAPSFECLRYVAMTGGDEITRQMAIVWLDQEARRAQPPSSEYEKWLMDLLQKNGHATWDEEYRLWLFNSAFNLLQHARDQDTFNRFLLQLATRDPHRTMRLYALQHIGSQQAAGNIETSLAREIQNTLRNIVAGADGEVAGSAIALLTEWDSENPTADPEISAQAAAMTVGTARPIDVRVTALHAAGPHALPTARELAADTAQPVILRKAAIALIGRHGSDSDFPGLEKISGESSRLAQAAQPALQALRHRIAHPDAPAPIPF